MKIGKASLFCVALLCGCAHAQTTAASADAATATETSTDAANGTAHVANRDGLQPGTGHLILTGSESLSKDFKVSYCQNDGRSSNPSMSGYSMNGGVPDGSFGAGITVADYDEDGTYHPLTASAKASSTTIDQATKAMSGKGILSGLAQYRPSLNVILSSGKQTRPVYSGENSTLVVTISNHGLDGTATFTNWLALAKQEENKMGGDPVSGSMAWSCIGVKEPD